MDNSASQQASCPQDSGPDWPSGVPLDVVETIIEPHRGWLGINLGEIWKYREMLYFLTWRDVKVRYKQTVLGFLWAFLQPCATLVVFTVIFGMLVNVSSEGQPYALFAFVGLGPWLFFEEALRRSSHSVVGSASLLTKVYFPRLIIPAASVGGCLIDFAITYLILTGLMIYYGIQPGLAMFMVLPLTALTVVAALGAGCFLSALNVAYRDFRFVIPFMLRIWMFATPVVWSFDRVKDNWPNWYWVFALNPMAGIVDSYRVAVLRDKPFDWTILGTSVAVSLLLLLCGLTFFRRLERHFADIV